MIDHTFSLWSLTSGHRLFFFSSALTLLSCFLCSVTHSSPIPNLTNQLEYIGTPYSRYYPAKKQLYARNIWDMAAFDDKIYLGAGNSSNHGPSPNAGPVIIIAYSPNKKTFTPAFQTSEEQIDQFYQLHDTLFVPGHDPRENWELGNIYELHKGQSWRKKRTIPLGIHTYSLYSFNDLLFAALGTGKGGAVSISANKGKSWNLTVLNNTVRCFSFLEVDNELFAVSKFLGPEYRKRIAKSGMTGVDGGIFHYRGDTTFKRMENVTAQTLFPDTNLAEDESYKVTRPIHFREKALYIGATIHNDHQSVPFGLYVAYSLLEATDINRITLPAPAAKPWDTFCTKDFSYVLLNNYDGKQWKVSVIRSHDLTQWQELFYFESSTMARSFTLHNGVFYFSLGSEIDIPEKDNSTNLSQQTGSLFKLTFPEISQQQLTQSASGHEQTTLNK